jgi:hypothetical protein
MQHASAVAQYVQNNDNEVAWVAAYVQYHASHFQEYDAIDRPHWEATKTWNLVNWQGAAARKPEWFVANLLQRFAPAKNAETAADADYELFIESLRVIHRYGALSSKATALLSDDLASHLTRGQRLYEQKRVLEMHTLATQMKALKDIIRSYNSKDIDTPAQLKDLLQSIIQMS